MIHLTAEGAACSDPFLATLIEKEIDVTFVDSWWHVCVINRSPKRLTFRRMLLDDRAEPTFVVGEIKLKAHN